MGVEAIVFIAEPFGLHDDLFNVPEQMGVQYVFPKGTVEPFYIAVLTWPAGLDIFDLDILNLTIVHEHHGEELRAVVHPYGQWLAIYLYGLL